LREDLSSKSGADIPIAHFYIQSKNDKRRDGADE
jgi:hypothetical protein